MTEDQAGHPGDHPRIEAGRDSFTAGRDIIVMPGVTGRDADQGLESEREAVERQASGQPVTGERIVFANHDNVAVGSQVNVNHGPMTINMRPSHAEGKGTV